MDKLFAQQYLQGNITINEPIKLLYNRMIAIQAIKPLTYSKILAEYVNKPSISSLSSIHYEEKTLKDNISALAFVIKLLICKNSRTNIFNQDNMYIGINYTENTGIIKLVYSEYIIE